MSKLWQHATGQKRAPQESNLPGKGNYLKLHKLKILWDRPKKLLKDISEPNRNFFEALMHKISNLNKISIINQLNISTPKSDDLSMKT